MQVNWDGRPPSPSLRRCARDAPGETKPMFSTSPGTLKRERGSQAGGQTQAKEQWHARVAWLEWRVCVKERLERKLGAIGSRNLFLGSTETPWLPDARVVLPGTKSGDIRRSVLYGAHRLWVRQSSATLLAEAPLSPHRTDCSLSHISVLHGE